MTSYVIDVYFLWASYLAPFSHLILLLYVRLVISFVTSYTLFLEMALNSFWKECLSHRSVNFFWKGPEKK